MKITNCSKFVCRLALVALLTLLPLSICLTDDGTTYMVPMRDGAELRTVVWLPEGEGPWPVLVGRSPYGIGRPNRASTLDRGYAIVLQSTRGRFGSEGENVPFLYDGGGELQDGYDCIEWVAKQPWCNGKIGTIGGSAGGITQYMMLCSVPPSLSCQYVSAASSSLYHNAMYQNGVFRKSMIEGFVANKEFSPRALDEIRKHARYDEMWKGLNLMEVAHKVNVPVFHRNGWYDIFVQGNIDAFVALQYHGGPSARGKQKMVIGAGAHGARGVRVGELTFPDNVAVPMPFADQDRWCDEHLKGEDTGLYKEPAVAYYLMGDVDDPDAPGNEWRFVDDWPVKAVDTPYYLRTGGRLTTETPVEENIRKSYDYDPKNPVPTIGGQNLLIPNGPRDQRPVEGRPDVIVFSTEPLAEPLEVTGRIRVKLYASSSARDTDFTAKLSDVYPDGRSMLITDGIVRGRYRTSLEKEEFLNSGEIYEFEIDLWSTAIVFNKGHRIRVAISSSNSPRFEPNPNIGDADDGKDYAVAKNTVYFDVSHPSAIVLPVVPAKSLGPDSN
jgi:uncharacterized protein